MTLKMTDSSLRIITRESPLAMWQAEFVRDSLIRLNPDIDINILGITTEADRFLDASLHKLGGKGVFVKELEASLLEGRADLAVHSMKDVVVTLPGALDIPVIMKRAEPGDAFVSRQVRSLDELRRGSVVGTSSLRRQCQLMAIRPDLEIRNIRGNVGTRLEKLDAGDFDALILASSGLKRLGLGDRIRHEVSMEIMLPAIGQGALGLEIRINDHKTRELVQCLNDHDSYQCVTAERMVNKRLNGGCYAPIAAHAVKQDDIISISGLVGYPDGSEIIKTGISGPADKYEELGDELGRMLLSMGADRMLEAFRALQDGR